MDYSTQRRIRHAAPRSLQTWWPTPHILVWGIYLKDTSSLILFTIQSSKLVGTISEGHSYWPNSVFTTDWCFSACSLVINMSLNASLMAHPWDAHITHVLSILQMRKDPSDKNIETCGKGVIQSSKKFVHGSSSHRLQNKAAENSFRWCSPFYFLHCPQEQQPRPLVFSAQWSYSAESSMLGSFIESPGSWKKANVCVLHLVESPQQWGAHP